MTAIDNPTLNTDESEYTEGPAPVTGEKAREAILSTVRSVLSHSSSCHSMKCHTAWLPRFLQPTVTGDYFPLNAYGERIGCTAPVKPRREWMIPASMLNLDDLKVPDDPDVWIDLFQGQVPWQSEGNKSVYINRLIQVFGIDSGIVRGVRRRPPQGVIINKCPVW
jgi:hypothetical protein